MSSFQFNKLYFKHFCNLPPTLYPSLSGLLEVINFLMNIKIVLSPKIWRKNGLGLTISIIFVKQYFYFIFSLTTKWRAFLFDYFVYYTDILSSEYWRKLDFYLIVIYLIIQKCSVDFKSTQVRKRIHR